MKVIFSDRAKADMAEIVRYIANDKPKAARKWAAEIRKSAQMLSTLPMLGRVVPEYGDEKIREIIKGQYRVVYKIDEEKKTIVILTVHHGKRLLL
jgi:addiction module RelE/StbE family toxin